MPLPAYGVMSGTLTRHWRDTPDDQGRWYHVHLELQTPTGLQEVAIDVDSKQSNTGVQWKILRLATSDFHLGPVPQPGFHPLAMTSTSGALDYVRAPALQGGGFARVLRGIVALWGGAVGARRWFRFPLPGIWRNGNSLEAAIALEQQLTIGATVLAWGEPWPSQPPKPPGVHNVHQNQGDPPGSDWYDSDGTWQDGGVAVARPDGDWQVFISRFSTQATLTDGAGHPA